MRGDFLLPPISELVVYRIWQKFTFCKQVSGVVFLSPTVAARWCLQL